MAEVTGMMLDRALAMEAATIVDGHIDGDGHLILERHDGDEIDAGYSLVAIPDASTTVRGSVELATQAETEAHTDAVRAVTPASLTSSLARVTALETTVADDHHISPASFNQATLIGSYPLGTSYLYLDSTNSTSGGWDFAGTYGLVTTYKYGADFIVQYWQRHEASGGSPTDLWTRTANSGGGWSAWLRMASSMNPASMGITGEVKTWSGSSAPSGWLLCDGAAVSRTTYANLYVLIGTTYGVGNGTTTFNVPNTKGRTIVGYDSGQTEFDTLGKTGGAKTHTLSTLEIPAHQHAASAGVFVQGGTSGSYSVQGGATYGFGSNANTANAGGGGAHNNLQPYIVMNHIIKT